MVLHQHHMKLNFNNFCSYQYHHTPNNRKENIIIGPPNCTAYWKEVSKLDFDVLSTAQGHLRMIKLSKTNAHLKNSSHICKCFLKSNLQIHKDKTSIHKHQKYILKEFISSGLIALVKKVYKARARWSYWPLRLIYWNQIQERTKTVLIITLLYK